MALSLALRPVGVTHHRALRSPDFPPAASRVPALPRRRPAAGDHPVRSSRFAAILSAIVTVRLLDRAGPRSYLSETGFSGPSMALPADGFQVYGELLPVGGGDPIPLLKPVLVVGRRESADIVLRFPNVSGSHCELSLADGFWTVKDLRSSNGIKVNGVRVTEQRLEPGDKLAVAKHVYEIAYEPARLGATSPPPETPSKGGVFSRSLLDLAGLEKPRPDPRGGGDKSARKR